MNDTILETERLLLRYQRALPGKGSGQDLDFLIRLWTDAEITKYVGGPRDKNKLINSFNEIAADPKKEEYDLWYVVLKGTDELIGMAGLMPKEIENESFMEVNYFIDREHWGNAYATEIAKGIISHYRNEHAIKEFVAIIDKDNIPSIKVATKIGMKYWKTVLRSQGEKDIYRGSYE